MVSFHIAGDLQELLGFLHQLRRRIAHGLPLQGARIMVETRLSETLITLQEELSKSRLKDNERIQFIQEQLSFIFEVRNLVSEISPDIVTQVDTIASMLRSQFFASNLDEEAETMAFAATVMSSILTGIPEVETLPESSIEEFKQIRLYHNILTNASTDYYLPFEASPVIEISNAHEWARKSIRHFLLYHQFIQNINYTAIYNECYRPGSTTPQDFLTLMEAQLSELIQFPLSMERYLKMGLWGNRSIPLNEIGLETPYPLLHLLSFTATTAVSIESFVQKVKEQISRSPHYLQGVKVPEELKTYQSTKLLSELLLMKEENYKRMTLHVKGTPQTSYFQAILPHFKSIVEKHLDILTGEQPVDSIRNKYAITALQTWLETVSFTLIFSDSPELEVLKETEEFIRAKIPNFLSLFVQVKDIMILPLTKLCLAIELEDQQLFLDARAAILRYSEKSTHMLDKLSFKLLLLLLEVFSHERRISDLIADIKELGKQLSIPVVFPTLWEQEIEPYLTLLGSFPVSSRAFAKLEARKAYFNPADPISWLVPKIEKNVPDTGIFGYLPFNFEADKIVGEALPSL